MNKLARVIAAIMNAVREAYATPIEHVEKVAPPPFAKAIDVVVPPPDREEPIQCTGQEELFSVYVAEAHWGTLLEQCDFHLFNIPEKNLIAIGAGLEHWAFWEWVRLNKSRHWLLGCSVYYNVYKISNAHVLEVCGFSENELLRYYCTLLDLPTDRFELLDYIWRDPQEDGEAERNRRQYALDHSAKKGKQ